MNVRLTSLQKVQILNSEDIFTVMQQVLLRENSIKLDQEHFWIVGLNDRNKILFIELISVGAANRFKAAPPDVLRMAIYKLAAGIILVHNHPAGSMKISAEDKDLTERMLHSGELLRIKVLDHLIISEHAYESFAETGVMEELRKGKPYAPVDPEKEKSNALKSEAELEKQRIVIATNLKRAGVDIETIATATGLKKTVISTLA